MCSRANEVGREDERERERGTEGGRDKGESERGYTESDEGAPSVVVVVVVCAICIMAFINQRTNLPFLNLGGGIHSEEEDEDEEEEEDEDTHPPSSSTMPKSKPLFISGRSFAADSSWRGRIVHRREGGRRCEYK